MAQIKLELSTALVDGMDVKFKAPCNCDAVTGLLVSYPSASGALAEKSFTFRDSHRNDLTGIGNLFSSGAYVKAILDTENGYAYLQNADTNKYLETRKISRANLANDALYSPVKMTGNASSTTYSFVADDIGKTILVNSKTMAMTLTQEVANAYPAGTEIAIFPVYSDAEITITFNGIRVFITGFESSGGLAGLNGSATVRMSETYSMLALKKMTDNNTTYGDIWTIQGNVEVVA